MILLVIQIVFRFIKSIEIYWNNSYIIWKELDEEILRLIYLPNINDIIYIKKKFPTAWERILVIQWFLTIIENLKLDFVWAFNLHL
jgi:hypothetical protein